MDNLGAASDAPLNPKMRRRIPTSTWYPGSITDEGAQPLVLQPGEHREGVDFELKKSPSFCMEGTVDAAPGQPPRFSIAPLGWIGGSYGGGIFLSAASVSAGPGGRFRICNLHAGTYSLISGSGPISSTPVTIADRDLKDLKITQPVLETLPGEVVLDGRIPDTALDATVTVFLATSLGARRSDDRHKIPSLFSIEGVPAGDFPVLANLSKAGLYIKEMTYGGQDVQYQPLHFGKAIGDATLRVVIGQDGGRLAITAVREDGTPSADARILLVSADVASEAALAARMIKAHSDQNGQFQSGLLAPGKYRAAACEESVDDSPESIARVWAALSRFQDLTVAPNGSAKLTLTLIKLQ